MAQRTVFIIDPITQSLARVDERGDVRTATVTESRTLEGTLFSHSFEDLSLSGGSALDILLETPASQEAILKVGVTGDGPLSLELYEAGTYTPPGSAETLINRNRLSGQVAQTVVWNAPTVTTVGTLLDKKIMSAEPVSLPIWVLDQSTRYLVRAVNPGGAPKSVILGIDVIE